MLSITRGEGRSSSKEGHRRSFAGLESAGQLPSPAGLKPSEGYIILLAEVFRQGTIPAIWALPQT
jgi:hypothetical protein